VRNTKVQWQVQHFTVHFYNTHAVCNTNKQWQMKQFTVHCCNIQCATLRFSHGLQCTFATCTVHCTMCNIKVQWRWKQFTEHFCLIQCVTLRWSDGGSSLQCNIAAYSVQLEGAVMVGAVCWNSFNKLVSLRWKLSSLAELSALHSLAWHIRHFLISVI
jgi:hypothetical protein